MARGARDRGMGAAPCGFYNGGMPTASHAISLNTAAVLTGRSTRTWQRRIEEGLVPRLGGGRALVPFDAVQPGLAVTLAADDLDTLVLADQGDATAQAEMGALFALAALQADAGGGNAIAARYFLEQAAGQGEADAMHWMGVLHAAGLCEGDANAQALMWVAKAAAHGQVIAREQLARLVPGAAAPAGPHA